MEGILQMGVEWVPTIKPSFLVQLQALPAKEMQQVLGKINLLLEDPFSHGKLKKQLAYITSGSVAKCCGNVIE